MAELPIENRADGEKDSLYINSEDGKTYKRTSAKGEFTFSGLSLGGQITMVTVNSSTWTDLTPTPLTDRNAIRIQNWTDENIVINHSNVVGGLVGVVVPIKGSEFYDVKGSIKIYAKSLGANVAVTVQELA